MFVNPLIGVRSLSSGNAITEDDVRSCVSGTGKALLYEGPVAAPQRGGGEVLFPPFCAKPHHRSAHLAVVEARSHSLPRLRNRKIGDAGANVLARILPTLVTLLQIECVA